MKKKYFEIVVEGHYDTIYGILEGFILGSGKKYDYFISKRDGIKTETLGQILKEWISLKKSLHHIILEADFYSAIIKSLEGRHDSDVINKKFVRSEQEIIEASFDFEAKTYGKKYGDEIKAIIDNLSGDIELHNYNPMEKVNKDAKGVEVYAPDHEYIFEATGTIKGDLGALVLIRKQMDEHPLIEVKDITIKIDEKK